jgi:membrane associated rhomboid family serine protease
MTGEDGFRFAAVSLCAVLAGVYSLQVLTGFDLAFNAAESPAWKFLVSMFGHSDLEHLANNAFFLGLFGSMYELLASEKAFFATFLLCGVAGNLSAFLFFPESFIIGASGGAAGVLAALAAYRPGKVGMVFGVPMPMWAVLLGYLFINFAGLTGSANVAYEAHLSGMLAGLAVGLRLRSRPYTLRVPKAESEDSEWRRRIREWEEEYMMD